MNVLFLTIGRMDNIENNGLYTDLLRCFRADGHNVYTVSTREKRLNYPTEFIEKNGIHALHVRVGNITKCGLLEKGLSTLLIENQFLSAIQKYICDVKFDLVLYSTPPITFERVIAYIKKRDGAKSYLLLKDIFPQNAVDLEMFSKNSLLYRFFRRKEKQLYKASDFIGCMSPANAQYLLSHNKDIDPNKVEICPNSIEVRDTSFSPDKKFAIRDKYRLPREKTIFVYGGNLGKPQGIPFMIECLKAQKNNNQAYFLIAGSGTDRNLIEKFIKEENPKNVKLLPQMPRDEFDLMTASCDIGMIFLDHRFTIPNFPSRLLSYMQAGLPVLACTDPNTDIGKIIVEGGFGWWCESKGNRFDSLCREICSLPSDRLKEMGSAAYQHLLQNYTVESACAVIIESTLRLMPEMRYVGKYSLLYAGENIALSYKKGILYCHNRPEEAPKRLAQLPLTRTKRVLYQIRLIERLLRLEPRCAVRLSEHEFVLSWAGAAWLVDVAKNIITREHSYRSGMNNPLNFTHVSGIPGISDCVLYGEYFSNPNKETVAIFSRTEKGWFEIYRFPTGVVNHIHGIVADPFQCRLLILTGDDDKASGIWETRDGFKTVHPLLTGSQKYRACVAFPNANGIIYATDTPLEDNAVYKVAETQGKAEVQKLFPMPGPCIYGCNIELQNGWRGNVMATSVEPDSRLKGWRYKLTYRLGPGVKNRFCHIIAGNEEQGFSKWISLPKDALFMTIFQFGNMKFPQQEHRNKIYAVPQSLKRYDASTISISVNSDQFSKEDIECENKHVGLF